MRDTAGVLDSDRCWQYLGSDTDSAFDPAPNASLRDLMASYLFTIILSGLLRYSLRR